jgi:hypothetical protein
MQEIKIKLWRHIEEKDWSAEVYGKLHKHISTKLSTSWRSMSWLQLSMLCWRPEGLPGNSAMPGNVQND